MAWLGMFCYIFTAVIVLAFICDRIIDFVQRRLDRRRAMNNLKTFMRR